MMKYYSFLLLVFFLLPGDAPAQTSEEPCSIQASISIGICIDYFCIPLFSHVEGGTPPYRYQWFNGDTDAGSSLNDGGDPTGLDTCLTLMVTDTKGCIALASVHYVYEDWPSYPQDSVYLANDSITVVHSGGGFNISINDQPFAQNYIVVQPPRHGDLVLNNDGTGIYTPYSNWCGPDYFRYTATDTGPCEYGPMTTVWINQSSCAGINVGKTDCNNSCNGSAFFFQNGILAPPLSFLWSNGSTIESADQLCKGPVSLTVTDGLGNMEIYNAEIEASQLQAVITGPSQICNSTKITLDAEITTLNIPEYQFYWSGPDIYSGLQFTIPTKPHTSTTSDSALYQLHLRSLDGCETTAEWEIEVFPFVSADVSVQLPQCPGDTLELRSEIKHPGTPPYDYAWSGPNGIQSNWPDLIWPDVTSIYSGRYYLTVTDDNGCSNTRVSVISIPDTCEFHVSIFNDGKIFCTGSEMELVFSINSFWLIPEKIEWNGPNGFYSNERWPIIPNATPNMTGWYHLSVQLGSTTLIDSVFYTVTNDDFYFASILITPPTECIGPYDGILILEMNELPPYKLKYTGSNMFQTVNSNPIVLNNMKSGYYEVEVMRNGCSTVTYVHIDTLNPPDIVVQQETCAGDDASISLNSDHTLTLSWSFPDGTDIYSTDQQSFTGLSPGTYIVTAKDDTTRCNFKHTVQLLPYLDFHVTVIDTPTCTSSDGSLLATPTGNATPPVTFEWNNGFIGNPATDLAPGGYSLTLTDSEGCSRHGNTVLVPQDACIAQVSGRVYVNTSCECGFDTTTVIFPSVKICATKDSETTCTFADNTGFYTLGLIETGIYSITASTYHPSAQGVCTEQSITIGPDLTKDTSGIDFFFCGMPESDLQVTVYCGPARPGFDFESFVRVKNNGIWVADTSLLTVTLSPLLQNPHFSPQPVSYDPVSHIAVWRIAKLALYQQFNVEITGIVNASLNDTLSMKADVVSLYTPDNYSGNNTSECSGLVMGSFDPNDKIVNPIGAGENGHISATDTVLTYTIRFQNTGTDTAFTVIVRDTLDTSVFDLSSITPLYSSHPYRLNAEDGNILVFTFDPIQLPDSTRNLEGSNGFVMFSIRLKNNLPEWTRIENSASIYFDYNEPVQTNVAQNTIVRIHSIMPGLPEITLMPNPAGDQTQLSINDTEGLQWLDVTLFSLDGAISKHLNNTVAPLTEFSIPIETCSLPSGIYFILIRSNIGQTIKKLVVISD